MIPATPRVKNKEKSEAERETYEIACRRSGHGQHSHPTLRKPPSITLTFCHLPPPPLRAIFSQQQQHTIQRLKRFEDARIAHSSPIANELTCDNEDFDDLIERQRQPARTLEAATPRLRPFVAWREWAWKLEEGFAEGQGGGDGCWGIANGFRRQTVESPSSRRCVIFSFIMFCFSNQIVQIFFSALA